MTLKLYQWPPLADLPNAGVFCMKLESYLRLTKIPHEIVTTRSMGKSPKKTMPSIETDGQAMSDSQLIIEHLEKKSASPVDAFLSAEQRAQANAYRRMLEHHLVNILIYFRWVPQDGWNQFSRVVFAGAPSLVRTVIGSQIRKGSVQRLQAMGLGRHAPQELLAFARQDLESIALFLGDKPFVFGTQISTLDLTVFSLFSNILYGGVEMPLQACVRAHSNLVVHASRVMQQIFGRDFKGAGDA
jgi:glutathione S-transferase